jgi:hypothetical protein
VLPGPQHIRAHTAETIPAALAPAPSHQTHCLTWQAADIQCHTLTLPARMQRTGSGAVATQCSRARGATSSTRRISLHSTSIHDQPHVGTNLRCCQYLVRNIPAWSVPREAAVDIGQANWSSTIPPCLQKPAVVHAHCTSNHAVHPPLMPQARHPLPPAFPSPNPSHQSSPHPVRCTTVTQLKPV